MSASNHAGFRRKTAVPKPVRNGFEQGADPARPTAVALFADGWALHQLWLFWLAPLAGAALGAILWKALLSGEE